MIQSNLELGQKVYGYIPKNKSICFVDNSSEVYKVFGRVVNFDNFCVIIWGKSCDNNHTESIFFLDSDRVFNTLNDLESYLFLLDDFGG